MEGQTDGWTDGRMDRKLKLSVIDNPKELISEEWALEGVIPT